jgi:uncharacterized membrane protein YhhN
MFSRRTARAWLVAYLVVSLCNVLAGLLDARALEIVSKVLLMPLLLAFFTACLDGLEHRLVRWVTAALVFSWIGDLLLIGEGDLFFVLGLVAFLGAQICYIVGFRPYAALGPLRTRPWLALPYLAYGAVLLALLLPDLGGLAVPVVIYAGALVTMAVLATGVSPPTAVGAIFFLLSDSLIALTGLTDLLPDSAGSLIMPTYILGQLLIVVGVLQNLGRLSGVKDLLPASR